MREDTERATGRERMRVSGRDIQQLVHMTVGVTKAKSVGQRRQPGNSD